MLFSTKKKPQQWLSGVRRKRKTNRQNTEDLYGNETTLYDTIMVGTCAIILLPKPIECTTLYVVTVNVRVNLKINYRLLVTVMCQCAFINCNAGTLLVSNVDGRGGCPYVQAGVCRKSQGSKK